MHYVQYVKIIITQTNGKTTFVIWVSGVLADRKSCFAID